MNTKEERYNQSLQPTVAAAGASSTAAELYTLGLESRMDSLWGKVHVEQWQQTPCLRDRVATEQDVMDGRAVFYLGNADDIGAVHVDIGLPHCAIVHADGADIPAVVVQPERADSKHYIGYRPISGGNGLCALSEVELLSGPDARFHQQT